MQKKPWRVFRPGPGRSGPTGTRAKGQRPRQTHRLNDRLNDRLKGRQNGRQNGRLEAAGKARQAADIANPPCRRLCPSL